MKNNLTLSKMAEDYLKTVVSKNAFETLTELLDKLDIPKIDEDIDFKKQYYEERAEKYGFKKE
ncbi:hypothetical protein [Pedobacter endophyticus]|nr:hypothetical protein [Pedobacter endophyticus]